MALVAALAAALVAGLASGVTGFGLALVLLVFYEPATVVPVTLFLGAFAAAAVVPCAARRKTSSGASASASSRSPGSWAS